MLVIQGQLWVTLIEAKNSEFSITKAIPQASSYMLASPNGEQATFGHGNNLYHVLRVLKCLRDFIAN